MIPILGIAWGPFENLFEAKFAVLSVVLIGYDSL